MLFQDDDDEDESDDEDETAELLAELQKIKKERAMEKQKLVGIYWGFWVFFLSHCLFFLNSILIFLICSSFFHSTSFIVHLNIPGGSFHKNDLSSTIIIGRYCNDLNFILRGARCSSVVRDFAHGAMGRRIDPSWGGLINLLK